MALSIMIQNLKNFMVIANPYIVIVLLLLNKNFIID